MIDWKFLIVQMAYWKQIEADHDPDGLQWYLPKVGAKWAQISAAEAASGIKFPVQYKDFLSFANGWREFSVDTNLFGTDDFFNGHVTQVCRRSDLAAFVRAGRLEQSIPIGASEFNPEVFLLISDDASVLPGGVIWYHSEEMDRYLSFYEFYASMTNYQALAAKRIAEKYPKKLQS